MEYIHFHYVFQGEQFDPGPLLDTAKFRIADHHRAGDIGKRRGSIGRALQEGYICVESAHEDFNEFVKDLYAVKELIVANGADTRVVYLILSYKGQCNWEFDPSTLAMLAELGLTLAISCSEVK